MNFGEHITLDGYGGDYKLLNSRENVESCFAELLQLLDMHALTEPKVIEAPDNQIKDPGGWSGFVIIAESHIAMHTFPKRGFISADVYTCKNGMDLEPIKDFFTKKFELSDIETNFIKRGLKYPEHNLL
jgi:S-adenosylmethionine decarboxylase